MVDIDDGRNLSFAITADFESAEDYKVTCLANRGIRSALLYKIFMCAFIATRSCPVASLSCRFMQITQRTKLRLSTSSNLSLLQGVDLPAKYLFHPCKQGLFGRVGDKKRCFKRLKKAKFIKAKLVCDSNSMAFKFGGIYNIYNIYIYIYMYIYIYVYNFIIVSMAIKVADGRRDIQKAPQNAPGL
jgi:hypothetical protein